MDAKLKQQIHDGVRAQGNQVDLGMLANILTTIAEGSGGVTKVTYDELVALRNEGKLNPMGAYRITDFVTTTSQEETRSAGHPFDIIVLAQDESHLFEEAKAVQHEDDDYFANSNLSAWELKYCLDNDTKRFAWAEEDDGKGVIYFLKDEWDNECPYDFKNIQFKRYKDDELGMYKKGDGDNKWCYTFCMLDFYDGKAHDVSVEQTKYLSEYDYFPKTKHNKILPVYEDLEYDTNQNGYYSLNDIVFVTDTEDCAVEEDYSYGEFDGYISNTFGNDCGGNTFGDNCHSNIFGNNCSGNTFGGNCHSNIFGNNCSGNTFGLGCHSNTFGNNCSNNTFGSDVYNNAFGNDILLCSLERCYGSVFCDRSTDIILLGSKFSMITIFPGVSFLKLTCSDTALAQKIIVYPSASGLQRTQENVVNVTGNATYTTIIGSAQDVKIDV